MFKRLRASIRDGFARAFPMVDPFMMVGPDPGQCAVSASAPPAPTPCQAGSDLGPHSGYLFRNPDTGTEWSENHPVESGECDDAEEVRPATLIALREELFSAWEDAAEQREGRDAALKSQRYWSGEAARAAKALAEAKVAPPPAEDLAGQGEPVAWRVGSHYNIHVYEGDRPVATFHSADDAARAVAAVNAAPAPSRPADREAEAIIVGWYSIEKLALEGEVRFAESPVVLIAASDLFGNDISALRDAPRDGGDGWLPIETAPKDGTLIGVGGGCAIWNDNGGFWHTAVGRDYGRRIQWKVTHWKNLDPATIPPSPNAGDGTRDIQPGAVEHRSV